MKKLLNHTFLKKYFKSLQFRMFAIFVLVGLTPIILIKSGILRSYEKQAITQRGEKVQSQ